MAEMKMVTVRVGDAERVMTPKDALAFAYQIMKKAADAVPREDGAAAPHLGDIVFERPAVKLRVEPDDKRFGGRSVAIVVKGSSGPAVWLWFDEEDAVALGQSLITMASPAAGGAH